MTFMCLSVWLGCSSIDWHQSGPWGQEVRVGGRGGAIKGHVLRSGLTDTPGLKMASISWEGGQLCAIRQRGQTATEPPQPASYSVKSPLLMHLSCDSKTPAVNTDFVCLSASMRTRIIVLVCADNFVTLTLWFGHVTSTKIVFPLNTWKRGVKKTNNNIVTTRKPYVISHSWIIHFSSPATTQSHTSTYRQI